MTGLATNPHRAEEPRPRRAAAGPSHRTRARPVATPFGTVSNDMHDMPPPRKEPRRIGRGTGHGRPIHECAQRIDAEEMDRLREVAGRKTEVADSDDAEFRAFALRVEASIGELKAELARLNQRLAREASGP